MLGDMSRAQVTGNVADVYREAGTGLTEINCSPGRLGQGMITYAELYSEATSHQIPVSMWDWDFREPRCVPASVHNPPVAPTADQMIRSDLFLAVIMVARPTAAVDHVVYRVPHLHLHCRSHSTFMAERVTLLTCALVL
jgi:hypothetical protein